MRHEQAIYFADIVLAFERFKFFHDERKTKHIANHMKVTGASGEAAMPFPANSSTSEGNAQGDAAGA